MNAASWGLHPPPSISALHNYSSAGNASWGAHLPPEFALQPCAPASAHYEGHRKGDVQAGSDLACSRGPHNCIQGAVQWRAISNANGDTVLLAFPEIIEET